MEGMYISHVISEVKRHSNCTIQLSDFVRHRLTTYMSRFQHEDKVELVELLITGILEIVSEIYGPGYRSQPCLYTVSPVLVDKFLIWFENGM